MNGDGLVLLLCKNFLLHLSNLNTLWCNQAHVSHYNIAKVGESNRRIYYELYNAQQTCLSIFSCT